VAALKNKSVDASASVEPGPALAIRNGDAVLIKSDDEILPNHQIAVLLYSEEFAFKRADAARRFMRAYIRAVRFYNGALKNGRLDGANADDVIAILSEATPIKSRDIYKLITRTDGGTKQVSHMISPSTPSRVSSKAPSISTRRSMARSWRRCRRSLGPTGPRRPCAAASEVDGDHRVGPLGIDARSHRHV